MFSRHSKLLESSKLSFSLDDMRRKSIVKKISRERVNSFTEPISQKEDYIIVSDDILINLSEKKCEEYDIYNKDLYRKNIKLFNDIKEKLSGSVLELKNEPIPPPEPDNLTRLILLKQRNQSINCLEQTTAVLYLLSHGYTLVNDITKPINTVCTGLQAQCNATGVTSNLRQPGVGLEFSVSGNLENKKLVLFEPYQAIAFANELSHIRGEDWHHITSKFNTYKVIANNTIPSAPPFIQSQSHDNLEIPIMFSKYVSSPLTKPASHF